MSRVTVDRDSVNDEFVVVRKLYVQSGSLVCVGERILEIESSKTMKEVVTPEAGVLKLVVGEGDEVAVGAALFEVEAGTVEKPDGQFIESNTTNSEISSGAADGDSAGEFQGKRELSRAASELARKLCVDIQSLPAGWLTTSDVLVAAGQRPLPQSSEFMAASPNRPAPAVPKVAFRRERMSLRKRTEGRNLARANGSGTTSMIGVEIPIPGPRLVTPPFIFQESIADLVVYETSRLVRRFPELNAFYMDERTVGYFDEVNIGISFDAGQNLKVLAISNADNLSLPLVQETIELLLHLYESGASIEDRLLTTSTVTISDLSRTQADFMLPLLNADQSLILGITRRSSIGYALHAAFDHRVSEGLQVAAMLGELRERIISHHRSAPEQFSDPSALRCSVCDLSLQDESGRGGRGLIRVVLANGSDGRLCWNCLNGW